MHQSLTTQMGCEGSKVLRNVAFWVFLQNCLLPILRGIYQSLYNVRDNQSSVIQKIDVVSIALHSFSRILVLFDVSLFGLCLDVLVINCYCSLSQTCCICVFDICELLFRVIGWGWGGIWRWLSQQKLGRVSGMAQILDEERVCGYLRLASLIDLEIYFNCSQWCLNSHTLGL